MSFLLDSPSLYLRSHATSAVHWRPLTSDLVATNIRSMPFFVSIGFSSCFQCQEMFTDVFNHEEVAEVLNSNFIPVIVDYALDSCFNDIFFRYAYQVLPSVGWPLNIWCTSDFVPVQASCFISKKRFLQICSSISYAFLNFKDFITPWSTRFISSFDHLHCTSFHSVPGLEASYFEVISNLLSQFFDLQHPGLGLAPKFPCHFLHSLLIFLSRRHFSFSSHFLRLILSCMQASSLYDHVNGGFFRYCTSATWSSPIFEKMLADNAQLLRVYVESSIITGENSYMATALGIFEWCQTLKLECGSFAFTQGNASSDIASSFYTWSYHDVCEVLGDADSDRLCSIWCIGETRSVPNPRLYSDFLQHQDFVNSCRLRLREARCSQMDSPLIDSIAVTADNALLLSAFCRLARVSGSVRHFQAAVELGRSLVQHHMNDDFVFHSNVGHRGSLLDYSCAGDAFLDLYQLTADETHLIRSISICCKAVSLFHQSDHQMLLCSSKFPHLPPYLAQVDDLSDHAYPSAIGIFCLLLARLSIVTRCSEFSELTNQLISGYSHLLLKIPSASSLYRALHLINHPRLAIINPPFFSPSAKTVQQAVFASCVVPDTEVSYDLSEQPSCSASVICINVDGGSFTTSDPTIIFGLLAP